MVRVQDLSFRCMRAGQDFWERPSARLVYKLLLDVFLCGTYIFESRLAGGQASV